MYETATIRQREKLARTDRIIRYLVFVVALGVALVTSPTKASQPGPDSQFSRIMAETEQAFKDFFAHTDVHIIDPARYVRQLEGEALPVLDMSGFMRHVQRQIGVRIPVMSARRMMADLPRMLVLGELAAGLYPLTHEGYVCLISGADERLTVEEFWTKATGLPESQMPQDRAFTATDLLQFLLYHEMAHCAEDPSHYQRKRWTAYDIYRAESLGDAFAVLMHLRDSGSEALPQFHKTLRQLGLKHAMDAEHMTADVIEAALHVYRYQPEVLSAMDTASVLRLAHRLVVQYALPEQQFAQLQAQAWQAQAANTGRRIALFPTL